MTSDNTIKINTLFANFGLLALIEQRENDNNDIVIGEFFFWLDKGHEAENLQKDFLFLLYYHFPMEDSRESLNDKYFSYFELCTYVCKCLDRAYVPFNSNQILDSD